MLLNRDQEVVWADTGSPVAMVKTEDRSQGVRASLSALGINPVKGKDVLIKPNFNTADPTPGSTHNDTLSQIVRELQERDARSITLAESSGPPRTCRPLWTSCGASRAGWRRSSFGAPGTRDADRGASYSARASQSSRNVSASVAGSKGFLTTPSDPRSR